MFSLKQDDALFVFQQYNISKGHHKKIDMTTTEKNWVLFQVHRDHYVITFQTPNIHIRTE